MKLQQKINWLIAQVKKNQVLVGEPLAWDENGMETCNWNVVLDAWKWRMGYATPMRLSDVQLTSLSLGVGFGPMPIFTEAEAQMVHSAIWKHGNPYGGYHNNKDMIKDLTAFAESL